MHRRRTPKSRPDEEPKEKAKGAFYGGFVDKKEFDEQIAKAESQAEERKKKAKQNQAKKKRKLRKARKSAASQPKKASWGDVPDIVAKGEVHIPDSFWVGGNPWKEKLEDKKDEKE